MSLLAVFKRNIFTTIYFIGGIFLIDWFASGHAKYSNSNAVVCEDTIAVRLTTSENRIADQLNICKSS